MNARILVLTCSFGSLVVGVVIGALVAAHGAPLPLPAPDSAFAGRRAELPPELRTDALLKLREEVLHGSAKPGAIPTIDPESIRRQNAEAAQLKETIDTMMGQTQKQLADARRLLDTTKTGH